MTRKLSASLCWRAAVSAAAVSAVVLAAGAALSPIAAQSKKTGAATRIFPYPIVKRTLPNGLDVIVIETPEFKDVLSFNTLVVAGARNETEKGKTGLAHLFEHILFRHRYSGEDSGYERRMGRLGTHNNAWTSFDVTYYHPLTFTSNLQGRQTAAEKLPGVLPLEADRFARLDFTEKIFRTEAGAVLGEYRRNASSPSLLLNERLLALMFPRHPYGHTTIGYYDDVVNMPNVYEAAVRFYDTYYRPNNCVLVIAGAVKADAVLAAVEPYYRDWQRKDVAPIRATGEAPRKEQQEFVPWGADVAPLVWVGYRMPAFRTGDVETAVGQLLGELLVSQAAPLYRKLRYDKQTASALYLAGGSGNYESLDPRALVIAAQLYKDKHAQRGQAYFDEVATDIIGGVDELKNFSTQKNAKGLLEMLKSRYRYDFLAAMSSPAVIAENFAWYYRFDRDPEVFEKMLGSVGRLTPRAVEDFARTYFVPDNRVVLTLAYQPGQKAAQ